MPMYDLKCVNCSHEFEDLLSSYNEVSATSCEKCGMTGLSLKPSLIAGSLSSCGDCSSSASCNTRGYT